MSASGDCTGTLSREDWLEKGEWLQAAQRAGASKVFFIENNPVVVFAHCSGSLADKFSAFNRLWCLSRPRILFLEHNGELSVIDLAQAPIDPKTTDHELRCLATLRKVENVANELADYHRNEVESGKVFEGGRFGSLKNRADQALIGDLKTVRSELIAAGLKGGKLKYAHALIGRSIFIRYLEDRKILTREYWQKIAADNTEWSHTVDNPTELDVLDFSDTQAIYPRVLSNKEFTYALFKSLSKDFNGDMFPDVDDEKSHVSERHLVLIRDLLYGNAGIQKRLFFFSYKFDIIPLDLISAIYEEFYHSDAVVTKKSETKSKARQDGVFYTPPTLAEFVQSRILTQTVLDSNPRVLDPACGSGIFLVEAFRRIVRHKWAAVNSKPSFGDLKEILKSRIAGIEVNPEAARITAFSLYLSMLHYLDPPSILEHIDRGDRLPNLLSTGQNSPNHFHSLYVANAFEISANSVGKVDVVVGNPPWGAPGATASREAKAREQVMLDWCEKYERPIGDKEPSQAFLWRVLDFLREGGKCALLTSHGVLFKHGKNSQKFRRDWLEKVQLEEVFNFTHVRRYFFQDAISPFLLIHFSLGKQQDKAVEYWSPKQILSIQESQFVLLSKYDRALVLRQDLADNKTWKMNWFGRPADLRFYNSLKSNTGLAAVVDREHSGIGYQASEVGTECREISSIKSIKTRGLYRYGKVKLEASPSRFRRKGQTEVYHGKRIIVKRGISTQNGVLGEIVSRLEEKSFAFNHSAYGIKLKSDLYDIITGILWSSFTRYYLFNISSTWGLWHDEVHFDDEVLSLPIPANLNSSEALSVVEIVDKLRDSGPSGQGDLLDSCCKPESKIWVQQREWEKDLDKAVFDLYRFTDLERDLIQDCCEITLPFFYKPYDSVGMKPAVAGKDVSWLRAYAKRFARGWSSYLDDDTEMRADVHIGASGHLVAVEFYPADAADAWDLTPKSGSLSGVLDRLGDALQRPVGTSKILTDGICYVVTDDSAFIIKRNEKRFWVRSLGYEDAELTLAQRIMQTMPKRGGTC